MEQNDALSFWEKLSFLGAIGRAVASLAFASLTAAFRGSTGAPTFKRHVLFTAMRTFSGSTTIRMTQISSPSTTEVYEAWAREKGTPARIVRLGAGTAGCWVGDEGARVVLIWFHGGGYVSSATKAHLDLMLELSQKADAAQKQLSVFMVQYDLAPHKKYPHQLKQAQIAVQHILEKGRSASQLILGGDSAGGNLALALLSHQMHPHPEIPVLVDTKTVFRGVCLISPWVTFDQSAVSYSSNALKDCLSAPSLKLWADEFMGSRKPDYYSDPLNAPPSWWVELPAPELLITAGQDEVFCDDIEQFSEKVTVKAGLVTDVHYLIADHRSQMTTKANVEILFADDECHDAPILERMLGFVEGRQAKKLSDWVFRLA